MTDDPEDEDPYPPPYHDKAGVHVMREPCSTCIFQPGNRMSLRPGRLAELTRETDRTDSNVICHQTLQDPRGSLCHGSVERRPGQLVRIAERFGGLLYDGEGHP